MSATPNDKDRYGWRVGEEARRGAAGAPPENPVPEESAARSGTTEDLRRQIERCSTELRTLAWRAFARAREAARVGELRRVGELPGEGLETALNDLSHLYGTAWGLLLRVLTVIDQIERGGVGPARSRARVIRTALEHIASGDLDHPISESVWHATLKLLRQERRTAPRAQPAPPTDLRGPTVAVCGAVGGALVHLRTELVRALRSAGYHVVFRPQNRASARISLREPGLREHGLSVWIGTNGFEGKKVYRTGFPAPPSHPDDVQFHVRGVLRALQDWLPVSRPSPEPRRVAP